MKRQTAQAAVSDWASCGIRLRRLRQIHSASAPVSRLEDSLFIWRHLTRTKAWRQPEVKLLPAHYAALQPGSSQWMINHLPLLFVCWASGTKMMHIER